MIEQYGVRIVLERNHPSETFWRVHRLLHVLGAIPDLLDRVISVCDYKGDLTVVTDLTPSNEWEWNSITTTVRAAWNDQDSDGTAVHIVSVSNTDVG